MVARPNGLSRRSDSDAYSAFLANVRSPGTGRPFFVAIYAMVRPVFNAWYEPGSLLILALFLVAVEGRAEDQPQRAGVATGASRGDDQAPAPAAPTVPGEPRPEGKGRPAADLPSSVSQPASPHPRPPSPTEPTAGPTTEELTEARRHFETALERYSRGQYRGAIAELEQARKLDPEGKDLVYNLALVHEKLGELSTALNYFRLYLQMEDDENERARTEASIIRVEGALAEVDASSAAPAAHVTEGPSYPVVAHLAPGKFDGWVWVTGGVAVAATLVGALLGSKALATAPGDADATAGGRSARDFRQDAHRARAYAVAADVSFGVAAVSGASAAFLYFGRSAEASSGAVRASAHGPVQPLPEPSTILLALSGGLRF